MGLASILTFRGPVLQVSSIELTVTFIVVPDSTIVLTVSYKLIADTAPTKLVLGSGIIPSFTAIIFTFLRREISLFSTSLYTSVLSISSEIISSSNLKSNLFSEILKCATTGSPSITFIEDNTLTIISLSLSYIFWVISSNSSW